ncbi:MAG: hypothetical protein ABI402_06060 [Ferruginibacter sp.]
MTKLRKNANNQISLIATSLAEKFVKPMYEANKEKNYFVYVSCLSEILNWSGEFYNNYFHKLNDWKSFETSKDNIYNAVDRDDFLMAWGCNKIRQFFVNKK